MQYQGSPFKLDRPRMMYPAGLALPLMRDLKDDDVVGAILAGGQSVRFGSTKALALLGRKTLIERVIDVHREVFSNVVVVTDVPPPYRFLTVSNVSDMQPGNGPLGGLQTALYWALEKRAEGVCCTPCDAPFLSAKLFLALLDARGEFDAVIPKIDGKLEPLFAWYSARTLPVVERCISEGKIALHEFIDQLPSKRFLPADKLPPKLNPSLLFSNVNTPDDLRTALQNLNEFFPDEP